MKATVINHPLREIHMRYNSEKPLSDFEEKALREYLKMHNDLHAFTTQFDALNGNLLKLEIALEGLEEEIALLDEELKKCGPVAGYTPEECEQMGVLEGCAEVTELINNVLAHQNKMNEYYNELRALEQTMNKWDEDTDPFGDEIHNYRDNFAHPIIQNWENMEIDICAYDDDLQEFYGFVDDLFLKKNPRYTKTWNEYMVRFNAYLEKVRAVFARTDKMNKTAKEIINKEYLKKGFGAN